MKQHQLSKAASTTGATRSQPRPPGPTDQPDVDGHGLPGVLDPRVTTRAPESQRFRLGRSGPGRDLQTSRHPRHGARAHG
ncbi:MAG: hypothetical protein ACXVAE_04355 [Candidatus Limnocylindrales bacterium]